MLETHHRRIRFSLLNTVFLMTIFAMAVALWQLYSKLQPLREEVVRLRNESGYLTVDDSNRNCVHAIQVDTADPLFWKWKVYLPEGQHYRLGAFVGKLPPKGKVPDKPGLVVIVPTKYRGGSEQIVKISVIRNSDGKLVLRQELGGISSEAPMNAEQEEILTKCKSTYNGRGPAAGFGGTSHVASNEPLVLLNQQRWGPDNPKGINGEAKGIIVWIEPVEHTKNK